MPIQNISEIKRPVRSGGVSEQQIRERLSKIEMPGEIKKKEKFELTKKTRGFISGVVAVLLVGLTVFLVKGVIFGNYQQQNKSDWQAVFLSNGQVYFGQIIKEDKEVVVMTKIYYLQESRNLQQGQDDLNKQVSDISLIKLGQEIHGPYDEMRLNRVYILFIEDLKDDSKVVKAIKTYEEKR